MTVSIVIPCFNHAAFVAEAIESALAQTWPHVEVVVVDDGSTDDSAAIARRYPVRLVQQANQGLSGARNAGLAASTGEVVIFLDADDRLRPAAAERAAAALNAFPRAMLAVGRCALVDEAGRPLHTNLPCVTSHFYEELLRRNHIWTPAMTAFRRCVFAAVGGFDPAVSSSADYDIYLRIARCHEIVAHDEVVAEYRQHGTSMSRDPILMLETSLAVLRRQRRFAAASRPTRLAYRAGIRHWRHWYGEHLVQRFRAAIRAPGGRGEAVRCAWHLLRLYPSGVVYHMRRKIARLMRRMWRIVAGQRAATAPADDSFRNTQTSHSPSR